MPVAVIVGARSFADSPDRLAAWRELQADLASISPVGELTIAAHSGHLVPLQQPTFVTDKIRMIVAT